MRRILLVCLLSLGALVIGQWATPVQAQSDVFDLVLDANSPDGDRCYQTMSPFESVTLHLIVRNPTLGGVSGWECAIEADGNSLAPSWSLSAGLDVDDRPDVFQVGIGEYPSSLMPNAAGVVLLASWTGFIVSTTDRVCFKILPNPDSVTFPGAVGYASPYDAGDLQACTNWTGDFNDIVFCINDVCEDPDAYTMSLAVHGQQVGDLYWDDPDNTMATALGALDGQDSLDAEADDRDIWFENPAFGIILDKDVRTHFDPTSEMKSWVMVVNADRSQSVGNHVALDFTATDIPAGTSVRLFDRTASVWKDLALDPSYGFFPGWGVGEELRIFDIEIGQPVSVFTEFSVVIDGTYSTLHDRGNVASTVAGASDGQDIRDTPEPPSPPSDYIAISFDHPEWGDILGDRFMRDVREPFDPTTSMKTWTFTVDADISTTGLVPISLSFDPSFTVSDGWTFKLRNHESGNVIDLFDAGLTYVYTPVPSGINTFDLMIGQSDLPDLTPASRNIPAGWSLVGMPLEPTAPATWGDVLLSDTSWTTYLFDYNMVNGYTQLDESSPAARNQGAWVGATVGFEWTMDGVIDEGLSTIALEAGWNLIGYPLWFPSDLFGVRVLRYGVAYSWGEAIALNYVGAQAFGYDPVTGYSAGTRLDTWHGYWVNANVSGLMLVFNPETMPIYGLQRWEPFARLDDDDNWRLDVSVVGTNERLSLGTCQLSSDEYDSYQDQPKAPPAPNGDAGPELYFARPDWGLATGAKLSQDIRRPLDGSSQVWDAVLTTPHAGEVTLDWSRSAWGGTRDLQLYLPEQNRVVVMSMRDTRRVVLQVGDEPLNIQIRTTDFVTGVEDVPVVATSLLAVPNPFNPRTEIRFTTAVAGDCVIRIFDVAGRRVQSLAGNALPAGGAGAVTWHGRDADGREVASGTYFARLVVDGRPQGEIRKLSLIR